MENAGSTNPESVAGAAAPKVVDQIEQSLRRVLSETASPPTAAPSDRGRMEGRGAADDWRRPFESGGAGRSARVEPWLQRLKRLAERSSVTADGEALTSLAPLVHQRGRRLLYRRVEENAAALVEALAPPRDTVDNAMGGRARDEAQQLLRSWAMQADEEDLPLDAALQRLASYQQDERYTADPRGFVEAVMQVLLAAIVAHGCDVLERRQRWFPARGGVEVHEAPRPKARCVARLGTNTPVQRITKQKQWAKVEWRNAEDELREGWVRAKRIEREK